MKLANGLMAAILAAYCFGIGAGNASAQGHPGNGFLPNSGISVGFLQDHLNIPGLPLHTLAELESSQDHMQLLVNLQDQWAREAQARQSQKLTADFNDSQRARRVALMADRDRATQYGLNSPQAAAFRLDVFEGLYSQQFPYGPQAYDAAPGFAPPQGGDWQGDPGPGFQFPPPRTTSKKATKAPTKPRVASRSHSEAHPAAPKSKPASKVNAKSKPASKVNAATKAVEPAPAR